MRHLKDKSHEEIVHEYINKMHRVGSIMRALERPLPERLAQARLAHTVALAIGASAPAAGVMFSAFFFHGELSDADTHMDVSELVENATRLELMK